MAAKQIVTICIPPELLVKIDSLAYQHRLSRSATIARLLGVITPQLARPEVDYVSVRKSVLEQYTLDV